VIVVRGLEVVRGGRAVLPGIDLAVPRGSVTGLLGPSGCGKSTLLRAVAGVQRMAAGTVDVLGLPAGSPALRRRLAYVTQAPSVYADLSVRENLRYLARILDVGTARIDAALATVALEDAADRVVGTLSGGQRARVSLASALLGEPEVLVLDEPTVGLDPLLRRDLWGAFHDLAAAGATLLISSHVMDEAERCDRLLLMREGRILADDAREAILERAGTDDVEEAFLQLIQAQEAA
jgi:ABC-2 type transport system ATP-binding protein